MSDSQREAVISTVFVAGDAALVSCGGNFVSVSQRVTPRTNVVMQVIRSYNLSVSHYLSYPLKGSLLLHTWLYFGDHQPPIPPSPPQR